MSASSTVAGGRFVGGEAAAEFRDGFREPIDAGGHYTLSTVTVGGRIWRRCACGLLIDRGDGPCPIGQAQADYLAALDTARRISRREERALAAALERQP